MGKFHKFETVVQSLNEEDVIDFENYGKPLRRDNIEYQELPIRLDSIIFYHPLKVVDLQAPTEEVELFDDNDIWLYANYITIVLVDGSQMTIKCNIQVFEDIIEGRETESKPERVIE